MPAVRMMQVAVDQVVDMVAMRYRFVAAAGAVHVVGRMAAADVARGTDRRIRRIDGDHMLIDMVAVEVMQVAIVQVVDVAFVLDRRVATAGTMDVRVIGMGGAAHECDSGGVQQSLCPVSGG
jgi:hypothetical protein